ncbi:hypothetical protein RN001_008760 [Aquatica leii]|uniref:Uncharacterized protein n=1 Tax=Aquatica leii TaxID=1421715 RepID=A0AAN7PAR0_9COLE|nr:hypothetical protein RN001_008760 [Aquatica leii]
MFLIHPHNYLPLDQIFVGSECKDFMINNLSAQEQNEVRVKILDFYLTLATEIINRLPLSGTVRGSVLTGLLNFNRREGQDVAVVIE